MPRLHRPPHRTQRGVGALVVVMVLFFIMSMVAAYASRNMIFEQRTSANNARSTQAFEAAEAGLEWAIAMLNGGRVDDVCADTNNIATDSFRNRHLEPAPLRPEGYFRARQWDNAGVDEALQPSCVLGKDEGGQPRWSCSCPSGAAPVLAEPAGAGPKPTFRIRLETVDQPGVVRVWSQGCSNFGNQCFAGATERSDAVAEVNALVGLAPSLTQTPAAAMTVRGDLDAPDIRVSNAQGAVINAGGTVTPANFMGPAGSPALVVDVDDSLPGPYYTGPAHAGGLTRGEWMFLAAFGMPPAVYRTQPAVVRMTCADACAQKLIDAAARFPGRVIWIDGDLIIDDDAPPVTIGSVAAPAVVIASGDMTFGNGSNVTINGVVYSRGARWVATGSTALVNGAFVAEGRSAVDPTDDGRFTVAGAPAIVFDATVLNYLKKAQVRDALDFGSIVRVPGSWRDFR
ncbi:MAG TPA: pilus assembly PilX N-terminal domain-containing protein [Rubrivivax sp.]